jgi:S1-C subfamily serine protease
MRLMAAILAFAATAVLAAPARAQDNREELKKKILSEIEKKLDAEMKRILEEVSKLIDEEFAKAKGRKPAPGTPSAGGAYLGIELDSEQPDGDDFKAWGVEGGVRIIPREGGPAAQSGLKDGDVIVELEGTKIREWPELPEALKTKKPGEKVKVKVLRGKETREITVTLGKRPEAPPGDAPPAPVEPKPEAAKPGRLGIQPGEPTGKGLAVENVSPDAPAAKAGVKAGDILVKLDDTPIWKESDLEAFMKKSKAGQKVEVTVLRGTEEKKFSVVLAER